MKEALEGERHEDDDEVKLAVLNWGNDVERKFLKDGIHKLVSRYEKCIEHNGDYVEK